MVCRPAVKQPTAPAAAVPVDIPSKDEYGEQDDGMDGLRSSFGASSLGDAVLARKNTTDGQLDGLLQCAKGVQSGTGGKQSPCLPHFSFHPFRPPSHSLPFFLPSSPD